MKTALNWFSVAAALIAVSCAKEMVSFHVSDARYGTLVARWADDPESRTAIQPDGTTVMWTGEERINVFFGPEYGAEFVSMRYGNRKETEFVGLFPKESAGSSSHGHASSRPSDSGLTPSPSGSSDAIWLRNPRC